MEQGTTAKLCECGCGQPAPIAKWNDKRFGHAEGQPVRFIRGHAGKRRPSAGKKPSLFVEIGQRIGRGVVIEIDVHIPRSRGDSLRGARLLCDCGNEYVSALQSLVGKRSEKQRSMSCGCLRYERAAAAAAESGVRRREHNAHNFIDRTGRRYGRLVVAEYAGRLPRTTGGRMAVHWWCRCDCGNRRLVNSESLASGQVTSCGCGRRLPRSGTQGRAAMKAVLCEYRGGARERNLAWELTDEQFIDLTSQACHYCGGAPRTRKRNGKFNGEFIFNGIDRMDNTRGYITGNVVPCCTVCNRAKRDMSYDDFLAWVARLTEYHWFHSEMTPSHLLAGDV